MRTVSAFTEIFVETFDSDQLTPRQVQMAGHISAGVATMQQLIRDLLSYRIEVDSQDRTAVSVAEASAITTNILSADISAAGATVTVEAMDWVEASEGSCAWYSRT